MSSCPFLEPWPYRCASHHYSAGCDPESDHKSLDSCSIACAEPGAFRELNGHSARQTNFGKSCSTPSAIEILQGLLRVAGQQARQRLQIPLAIKQQRQNREPSAFLHGLMQECVCTSPFLFKTRLAGR